MNQVVIIGAGIGGLTAAVRLAAAGCSVLMLETHATPGGKMRSFDSEAGPVDAGPTVLTLKHVVEEVFAAAGSTLTSHVGLRKLDVIARHYWDDGTVFDLFADRDRTLDEAERVFGRRSAEDLQRFTRRAARLFKSFDGPMMQTAAPDKLALTGQVMRNPLLALDMAPLRSLQQLLKSSFREQKLAQLYGRYATYVGGMPQAVPALLSLVSEAEARGVWAVEGGMRKLAEALEALARSLGVEIRYGTPVRRIVQQGGRVSGIETDGDRIPAEMVLFNGDPAALATGRLGPAARTSVAKAGHEPRSLSAYVHAFAARPSGPALQHHTVFFSHAPDAEFAPLAKGERPTDATLYVCAQDHGQVAATALQRFEIIMNAPPQPRQHPKEIERCQTAIFDRLGRFGLRFDPRPDAARMMTPATFERDFPASQGALYGRSPAGLMAAFKRPTARTSLPGLYLCGGGAHPGAGVPMAALSGKHAAEAILSDRTSTSPSRRTATRGGISTGSATSTDAPSLS